MSQFRKYTSDNTLDKDKEKGDKLRETLIVFGAVTGRAPGVVHTGYGGGGSQR